MGDTNLRFTLSADTSQLKRDFRNASTAMEKELKGLGYDKTSGGVKGKTSSSVGDIGESSSTQRRLETTIRKRTLETNTKLYNELIQIRRRMERTAYGSGATQSGGGGGLIPPPPNFPGGRLALPGSGGSNTPTGSPLSDVLNKLAGSATALAAAYSLFNYAKGSAALAREGNSLAYETYGSSLRYKDYKTARRESESAGSSYGYNSTEVMSANQAYSSSGGGMTADNWSNVDNILKTAKYTGLNTSSLGYSMGKASEYGLSSTDYSTLLANTVENLGLQGKENKAQDALDDIVDLLQQQNKLVSQDKVADTLSLWNMLAKGNESLQGSKGAQMASDLASSVANSGGLALLAASGGNLNSYEDALAAKQQLVMGNTSENLTAIVKQIDGLGIPESLRAQVLYKTLSGGGSLLNASADEFTKISEYMKHWDEIKDGTWSDSTSLIDKEKSDKYYKERETNYGNAEVSTEERYNVEKENADKATGDAYNGVANVFKGLFNGMPEWMQQGVNAAGSVLSNPIVLGYGGLKGFKWAKGKWSSAAKGAAKGATAGASGATGAFDSVTGKFTEINPENIVEGTAREVGDTVDDVLKNTDEVAKGASKLSKIGKWLGIAGTALEVGKGVYEFTQADTAVDKTKAVTGTAGSLSGGWGGAGAGAAIGTAIAPGIGTAIGGIVGAVGGATAGEALGEALAQPIIDTWESFKDSLTAAEKNYGTALAGDWNPFREFWKKDGTLIDQRDSSASKATARSKTGGLPSDFGMPKEFDNLLDISGNINWSGINNETLKKWKTSKEYQKFNKGFIDYNNSQQSLGAQVVTITKNDPGYNASLDPGNGLYDVFTGSKEQLSEYLKTQAPALTSAGYKTGKGSYKNPYLMSEVDNNTQGIVQSKLQDNAEATSNNTESVKTLTTEVETMRKLLESNGHHGTAAMTDKAVKSEYGRTMADTLGDLLPPTVKSNPIFSFFSKGLNISSHATGNDYVPYDNYTALLHKGEMVLTASEANDYRSKSQLTSNSGGKLDVNINVNGNINGMTSENQAQVVAAIVSQIQSSQNLQGMLSTSFVRTQNY